MLKKIEREKYLLDLNFRYGELCQYSAVAYTRIVSVQCSGVPRNFFGGGSTNSAEDRGQRERGSVGGSPLVRGSGGSCNLVQEISFHIVKFS